MPIHDWTRAEAGDFHHFRQTWIPLLAAALNDGGLPPGFMALADQVTGRPISDVVTLQSRSPSGETGGVALAPAPPPSARVIQKFERINYAKRADRVVIRHGRGRVVAIIEIVSPGNKDSRHALRSFVEKAADILSQGIHLVVVDLFPPTPRDPQGIHKAIWDEFGDEPFDFLPEKPLTVASYIGGDLPTAYVESVGVGDRLPAIPLFLPNTTMCGARWTRPTKRRGGCSLPCSSRL
jgi:Protein of unknown function (DUF4058)